MLTSAAEGFSLEEWGTERTPRSGMRKFGEDISNSRSSKFKGSEVGLGLESLENTNLLLCLGDTEQGLEK